jgi:multiple sugar transport system substrate-binding protein
MKLRTGFVAAVLIIAGCAGDDGSKTIDFWNFGGTTKFFEWIDTQVADYNTAHTEIRIVKSQKSWHMIRELLYTNFSAGTAPDVVSVHANYAAEFGESGFFRPIDDFADFDSVSSRFEPNLMRTTQYRGRHYGLPFSALAFVLVCNKDLFDAEGIDPPRTWSEFRAAAKQLTKDTDGDGRLDQWGLVLLGGDRGGFSYRLAPLMFKAGADILSEDLSTAVFDSPEAVSALQLLADMYQTDKSITPGFLAYTLSEINDLFSSNRVAMSIEGPWFRPMVDEKAPGKDFYTVPVPVPDARIEYYDTAPTLQDLVMFSISSQSENPEAAWEFVKFLRSDEADLQWLDKPMGGLPTTVAAWEDEKAPEKIDAFYVFRNELENARPWPPHPRIISIVRNIIAPYGQQAVIGDMSPQEAMRRAAAEAQELLDES